MPAFAKTTVPQLRGIHPRERLFQLLDQARNCRVVWVSGPPGAGKTTLVAGYLAARGIDAVWDRLDESDSDPASFFFYLAAAAAQSARDSTAVLPEFLPEYHAGLQAFARRFFRDLFGSRKAPLVVVLDDYQELPSDSALHELLTCGVDQLPPSSQLIMVSRHEPPEPIMRLASARQMAEVGPEMLLLTDEEGEAIARSRRHPPPTGLELQMLLAKAQGWAAGLVLLLEAPQPAAHEGDLAQDIEPQPLFDYFAGEILARMDDAEQGILLACAFVPQVTARMAADIAGHAAAAAVLERHSRRNHFIATDSREEPGYRFHPLFREFLQRHAQKVWPASRLQLLWRRSAKVCDAEGDVDSAVDLFAKAEDWPGMVSIILRCSGSLLGQGRHLTVLRWIDKLPRIFREGDGWLLFWRATAALPFRPQESQSWFRTAFALLRDLGDRAGAFRSWAGIVQATRFDLNSDFRQLDAWIQTLDQLLREDPWFPSPQVEYEVTQCMYAALQDRVPWHPGIETWKQRAIALAESAMRAGLGMDAICRAAIFELHGGRIEPARRLLDAILPYGSQHPAEHFAGLASVARAYHQLLIGLADDCLASVVAGLAASSASGIQVWDFALCCLAAEASLDKCDAPMARRWLDLAAASTNVALRGRSAEFHRISSALALQRGDVLAAQRHAEESLALSAGVWFEDGLSHGLLCQVRRRLGEASAAASHSRQAVEIARKTNSQSLLYWSLLQQASLALDSEDEAAGMAALGRAMAMGREQGYAPLRALFPVPELGRLCACALSAGIEPDYVRSVIRTRGLLAPDAGALQWPWPVIIFTLGRFSILLDEKPVESQGKAQRRPLEMLKLMLAMGGREISKDALIEQLWPGLDGDAAENAFDVAMHRLRKFLCRGDAVTLETGTLALNRSVVWVDTWAVERLSADLEVTTPGAAGAAKRRQSAQRLPGLYLGHFLPDESAAWAAAYRESLRSRFLRCVSTLGQAWLGEACWEDAIQLYLHALDVDPLVEEFHRGLIIGYREQGRTAAALEAYRRCHDLLANRLGVAPSVSTQEIYRSLPK